MQSKAGNAGETRHISSGLAGAVKTSGLDRSVPNERADSLSARRRAHPRTNPQTEKPGYDESRRIRPLRPASPERQSSGPEPPFAVRVALLSSTAAMGTTAVPPVGRPLPTVYATYGTVVASY